MHYMQAISTIATNFAAGAGRDSRVRWGLGAGASVLLSAGVLSMGAPMPSFLHASAEVNRGPAIIHAEQAPAAVVDMSTSTVAEIVAQVPKAERFELMLYNGGAGERLAGQGEYTVFVPASAYFDYLPKRYIAGLSRRGMAELALSHVVARSLPLDESLSGNVITLGNTALAFDADADGNATVGGAKVLKVYKASNGWVYIIDRVLVDADN